MKGPGITERCVNNTKWQQDKSRKTVKWLEGGKMKQYARFNGISGLTGKKATIKLAILSVNERRNEPLGIRPTHHYAIGFSNGKWRRWLPLEWNGKWETRGDGKVILAQTFEKS
jgi:hypothetical protein